VVYVSRTHAQLDQVTRELKRTPYRPMMSLLASRERFCLHADVQRADDKAAACADATHVGKGSCTHLEKAERIQYPHRPSFLKQYTAGGKLAVYDIEEIVTDNGINHVCPFHATRDLMAGGGSKDEGWGSGLILVTYQQFINTCVREASGTDRVVDDAIVIVDEAHNLDAVRNRFGWLSAPGLVKPEMVQG
jgi:Rad3-related DNA helicase